MQTYIVSHTIFTISVMICASPLVVAQERLINSSDSSNWIEVASQYLDESELRSQLSHDQYMFFRYVYDLSNYTYANAFYQCSHVTVSNKGIVERYSENEEPERYWDDETLAWMNENREYVIGQIRRFQRNWRQIPEASIQQIYMPIFALTLAYLQDHTSTSWLRDGFVFAPGCHYNGEGSYPHSYFDKHKNQFHLVFGDAIKYLTQLPLDQAIELDDEELKSILQRSEKPHVVDAAIQLYILYEVRPDIAKKRVFEQFRHASIGERLNLSLTIDEFILEDRFSLKNILAKMGSPEGTTDYELTYLMTYTHQQVKDIRYILTFDRDVVTSTRFMVKSNDGSWEEHAAAEL
jgi:hypothetical protein